MQLSRSLERHGQPRGSCVAGTCVLHQPTFNLLRNFCLLHPDNTIGVSPGRRIRHNLLLRMRWNVSSSLDNNKTGCGLQDQTT